jgi:hypothetical protein
MTTSKTKTPAAGARAPVKAAKRVARKTETTPTPTIAPPKAPAGKLGVLVGLLQHPDGVSLDQMAQATGWQRHSVRGALAGAIKHAGFTVVSEKTEAGRRYRIAVQTPAAAA